jgi:hypothetical protein
MQVSPQTIYRSLFVQSRGVLRRCLLKQLRRQHHFVSHAPALGDIRDNGRLSTPFPFDNGLQKSTIARCLAIGKATRPPPGSE